MMQETSRPYPVSLSLQAVYLTSEDDYPLGDTESTVVAVWAPVTNIYLVTFPKYLNGNYSEEVM